MKGERERERERERVYTRILLLLLDILHWVLWQGWWQASHMSQESNESTIFRCEVVESASVWLPLLSSSVESLAHVAEQIIPSEWINGFWVLYQTWVLSNGVDPVDRIS
jgi:hypothetical protein